VGSEDFGTLVDHRWTAVLLQIAFRTAATH
jgi:hypothetical protein